MGHAKDKAHMFTKKDINKLEKTCVMRTLILVTAYLMDEKEFTGDRIEDFWTEFAKWTEAIEHHLITIDTVCKIVSERTGLKIQYDHNGLSVGGEYV